MPSTVTDQIAERVRRLRSARGFTLEALANASGVSRSAISLIERAETSPTAVVLERLATGLGVPLAVNFQEVVHCCRMPLSIRPDPVRLESPDKQRFAGGPNEHARQCPPDAARSRADGARGC
jgi:transcriptional regulator with XRE-family HTH domain